MDFGSLLPKTSTFAAEKTTAKELQKALDDALPSPLFRTVQTIKPANWNSDDPYFFAVATASEDNGVVISLDDNPFEKYFESNKVPLLIPPSSITITTPFAINVSATNGGILEEHNGVVFRNIQISGTTGVFRDKTVLGNRNNKPGLAQKLGNAFAPATTAAITGLISQVSSLVKSVVGEGPGEIGDIDKKLKGNPNSLVNTGYFQYWQLYNFIAAYAQFKKEKKNEFVRLVFCSSKDNIAYVVTPLSFELKRDTTNPLLYHYNIALKSWDIVPASVGITLQAIEIPTPDSIGAIKAITDILRQGQKTITAATNVLSGVHSDITTVVNVYNQALIFLSNTAGVLNDVSNFGDIMKNNVAALLANSANNRNLIQGAIKDSSSGLGSAASSLNNFLAPSNAPSGATAATITGAGGSVKSQKTTPGGEDKASASQTVSSQAQSAGTIGTGTAAFQAITLDQLDIPEGVQAQIDARSAAAASLTAGDIRELVDQLSSISDNYVASINSMDPVYASTYGIPVTTSSGNKLATEDDILIAVAIEEARVSFLSTLATGQLFKERNPDPFLSANAHIPSVDQMTTPISTIAVPWQRGGSLDRLAEQYFGNSIKSRDIAVLNGLRAPYVDEVGFTLPILGATGRTFVTSTHNNIAINQFVTINGNALSSTRRQIVNIEALGGGQFRVTVSGIANLDIYSPSSAPFIFARLPGTVGPGDTILLPDLQQPDDVFALRPTPLYSQLTQAQKLFKVDIGLSQDGHDIDVGANGDINRSFGYNNATQAIRLAIETERGELERHITYGLPLAIGSRTADFSLTDVEEAVSTTISNDPRFLTANATATLNGSVVNITTVATGAQGTGQIPVTFDIGFG